MVDLGKDLTKRCLLYKSKKDWQGSLSHVPAKHRITQIIHTLSLE